MGLAGSPSRGQRSAAIANASWAASSASSMSPRNPVSVARTRPHWSRKMASSATDFLAADGPHLDRHDAGWPQLGLLRGDGERPVEVAGLDEDQAAEELLAVDERAVGQQRPVFLVTYRRRRAGCLQVDPAGHVRAGQDRC